MFGYVCVEVPLRQNANVGLAALNSLNPLSHSRERAFSAPRKVTVFGSEISIKSSERAN